MIHLTPRYPCDLLNDHVQASPQHRRKPVEVSELQHPLERASPLSFQFPDCGCQAMYLLLQRRGKFQQRIA